MINRRDFMKTSALAVAGMTLGGLFKSANALADAAKPACTTADPVANALGYVAKAKDIDTKKYKQFKKLAKNHNCKGCALYKETSAGMGNCTMLTNCTVTAEGLCGSWQKKA